MSSEGFPVSEVDLQTAAQIAFEADGSINETYFANNFGLGAEEASQVVTFGNYSGTVAQMLTDEGCPVGGMVKKAYEEKGLDGVVDTFGTLGQMDANFKVSVSEATRGAEELKKN